MGREYLSVEERHRILGALERLWEKYPYDSPGKLINRLIPEGQTLEEVSTGRMMRNINKLL